MKKPMLYVIVGALALSLAGNAYQFMSSRTQAAEQATLLANLHAQIETATSELSEAKANLAKLEQDHATLLADTATLEATAQQAPAVIETKPTNPPTSKPETKPTNPPTSKPESKPTPPPTSKPEDKPTPPPSGGSGGTFDDDFSDPPVGPGMTPEESDEWDNLGGAPQSAN